MPFVTLKNTLLPLLAVALLASCNPKANKENNSAVTDSSQSLKQRAPDNVPVSDLIGGNYVSSGFAERGKGADWMSVSVSRINGNEIDIKIRSRDDLKKPSCTLNTKAVKMKDGRYKAALAYGNAIFTFKGDTLSVSPETQKDEGALSYYCSGGGTIANTYVSTKEELK